MTSVNSNEQLLRAARIAVAGDRGVLSKGEHLGAALVLNRADWLAELDYTIPEALERIGAEWVALIPRVAKVLAAELAGEERAKVAADEATRTAMAFAGETAVVDFNARLVTYGHSPGYRSIHLVFDLQRHGAPSVLRAALHLSPEDGESVMQHVREVHAGAWGRGEPLDVREGEARPYWLKQG